MWRSLLGITCHATAQGTSFYPNGHMPPTHICLALHWAPVTPQPSTPSTALCTQACSFLCKPPAPPPSKPTPWLFEFPGRTETNPRIPQPMSSPHPWCQSLCGGHTALMGSGLPWIKGAVSSTQTLRATPEVGSALGISGGCHHQLGHHWLQRHSAGQQGVPKGYPMTGWL